MTGPEHYREAERLVNGCKNSYGALVIEDGTAEILAAAQVHATLAQAAATSNAGIPRGYILAEQCNIAESAHGRQCGKPMAHPGACDFTAGGAA
ncbi:hypothetical protein [Streptomyces fumanus]|uniref:hypothetical protein n=1 Tax=Streptomyces fumanus TaxID=67302 RepID=UPI0033DDDACE